ncbi:Retrovirus-related Pol polyprotein from transposon RE1 [Cardamine amara subsp. amara]|uniref:Retrovirus-related Pol polyprotein from transposon RE1 n=1 Tax=Cardamine amara subsp. amara TaxID=228776 RepID=A0ABD0Z5Y8_CARAN
MGSDSTAERTSMFNTQDPRSTLLSVNMSSVTKITTSNYLMWRSQVRALLEGHELHHFIDSSTDVPAPTIIVNGALVSNPAYPLWRLQDRLLYSAMIGALTQSVQTLVSTATTTKEVWDCLADALGNPTRGHIRKLKYQLKTCVKGTKSISEYLRLMKSKVDDLALLGKPFDPEDLTEQILASLSEEYKPEIDGINGRDNSISYTELYERLLNREAMLMCSALSSVVPIVANAADTRSRKNHRSNNYNQNRGASPHQPRFFNNNNNNQQPRFTKNYLGKCQACGVQGHSAKFCLEFRLIRGSVQTPQWSPQYQS